MTTQEGRLDVERQAVPQAALPRPAGVSPGDPATAAQEGSWRWVKARATRLPVDTQWTDLLIDYIYYLSRELHVHELVDGY